MIEGKVRVVIHASYYSVNYGDSLLMIRLVKYLQEKGGDRVRVSFPFMADPVKLDIAPHLASDVFSSISKSQNFDALILCGGGYFGEPPSGKFKWYLNFVRRHFIPVMRFVRRGKRTFAVGIGAGPVGSCIVRCCIRRILKNVSIVFARDKESAEFIRALDGQVANKVKDGSDLAQSRKFLTEISDSDDSGVSLRKDKYVAVHLTIASRYSSRLISLLDGFVDSGFKLVFFTDSPGHDAVFHDKDYFLYNYFSREDVQCFAYGGVSLTTSIIRFAGGVVTSKLHVGIVAATFSLPILSIPFHSKTYRYYRHIERIFSCVSQDDSQGVAYMKFDRFYNDVISGSRYMLPNDVEEKLEVSLNRVCEGVLSL